MLEKDLEKIFTAEVKNAGGYAYKFTSPGNDGVPDRIALLPDGRLVFVELKTGDGRLTRLQKIQCQRISSIGQQVRVLHGLAEIADFFEEFDLEQSASKIRNRISRGQK